MEIQDSIPPHPDSPSFSQAFPTAGGRREGRAQAGGRPSRQGAAARNLEKLATSPENGGSRQAGGQTARRSSTKHGEVGNISRKRRTGGRRQAGGQAARQASSRGGGMFGRTSPKLRGRSGGARSQGFPEQRNEQKCYLGLTMNRNRPSHEQGCYLTLGALQQMVGGGQGATRSEPKANR